MGVSRREFLTVAAATAALVGAGRVRSLAQTQAISQDQLLRFDAKGKLTILHLTDCHAQLTPIYFREPSINLGVGEAAGLPPHISGAEFLKSFGIAPGSHQAYALTSEDFVHLARAYGRVGGMDRMATLIKAIRAERGAENTLLLDGGDTWQGSYTALHSQGADMISAMNALGVDAMTGHWEFTYGTEQVEAAIAEFKGAFLAQNIRDTEWQEPVFAPYKLFERAGATVGVIGQAFPFTPIANPRWMIPTWSFGIREEDIAKAVVAVRDEGADIVVLLSHNGFDVDRKLAARVEGIDLILTGHTHDALPVPIKVGKTLLIATGSNTKFLSRIDLDVRDGKISDVGYGLIPVLADAITPDAEMAALVADIRKPHEAMLATRLGETDGLLYRRGNVNGSFDDLICQALIAERDAEIALSPGFRWGPSLLPGDAITWDDVYSATAITYPAAYRTQMTGAMIKDILEDVADNLFNVDPYYQQGGDMVRVGGLGYSLRVDAAMGARIGDMTLLKTGAAIDPAREYTVAGWASVNEGTEGPNIWDVVASHIQAQKTVTVQENTSVAIIRD